MFLANGIAVATWLSRIPDVREDLDLSSSVLGLVLLALSAGVLLALLVAGGLVPRFGSRRVLAFGATLAVVALPAAGATGGPWTLAAALLLFGAGSSTMDLAMNAQGARVERDQVVRRLGAATVVRLGGGLAGVGFVLVAAVPSLPAALVGFAMVGLGVAPIVPLVFSAAATAGRSAGEGIAAVATVGYGGFLAGPPVIGFVADRVDLRVSLLTVGAIVAVLTVGRGPLSGREG